MIEQHRATSADPLGVFYARQIKEHRDEIRRHERAIQALMSLSEQLRDTGRIG